MLNMKAPSSHNLSDQTLRTIWLTNLIYNAGGETNPKDFGGSLAQNNKQKLWKRKQIMQIKDEQVADGENSSQDLKKMLDCVQRPDTKHISSDHSILSL